MTKLIRAICDYENVPKFVGALIGRAQQDRSLASNVHSVSPTCTSQARKREPKPRPSGRVGRCCRLSQHTHCISGHSTRSFSADPCRPRHGRHLPHSGCHVSGVDVLVRFHFSEFKKIFSGSERNSCKMKHQIALCGELTLE